MNTVKNIYAYRWIPLSWFICTKIPMVCRLGPSDLQSDPIKRVPESV
jgi:hypothetical protein